MKKLVLRLFAVVLASLPEASFAWHSPSGEQFYTVRQISNAFWACNVRCYHLADDIPLVADAPVYAIGYGRVVFARRMRGYGTLILIEHQTEVGPIVSLYGHLGRDTDNPRTDDVFVSEGDIVDEGQKIGRIGDVSENGSTPRFYMGTHLHFALRRGTFANDHDCGGWRYAGYSKRFKQPEPWEDGCYCDTLNGWFNPAEFFGVKEPSLRILRSGVTPSEGIPSSPFRFWVQAEGGRAPVAAHLLLRDPNDEASSLYMKYQPQSRNPYVYTVERTLSSEGLYSFACQLSTCAEQAREENFQSGPIVKKVEQRAEEEPPPPCQPSTEACDNVDNDCDHAIDEGLTRTCSNSCGNVGSETCEAGMWRNCSAPVCPPPCIPQSEVCNGIDDDCDREIDEGVMRNCMNTCGGSGIESCIGGIWQACTAPSCPPPETPPDPPPSDPPPESPEVSTSVLAPRLTSPNHRFIKEFPLGTGGSVSLQWFSVSGASYYEYEVRWAGSSGSVGILKRGRTGSTGVSFSFDEAERIHGTEISWKVRSVAGNGTASEWSERRGFFFSLPIGNVYQCSEAVCPYPSAYYWVTSKIEDAGVIGVPSFLILEWVKSDCLKGRSTSIAPWDALKGYRRNNAANGCPY